MNLMNKKTIYIYLDANFILIPTQLKIDIYSEFQNLVPPPYKLIVLSAVFTELEDKIKRRKNKSQLQRDYHLARQILERRDFTLINCEKKEGELVDDLLLKEAIKCANIGNKVYLATNDKDLRRKCKDAGILTVFVRNYCKLDVE